MKNDETQRTNKRSKEQRERDREIRDKYKNRPSLASLVAGGQHEPPVKQGEYRSLMQLVARMKARRKKLKLSLTDVANRSGIDRAAISKLENGLVGNPTIATLMRLVTSLEGRLKMDIEDDMSVGAK
jgi:DNA-binding XRE family transcriptional regulator